MADDNVLDQLERILRIYERSRELELKQAEVSAKIAANILAENRKAQMDLLQHFSQFLTPPPKKDDE